MEKNNIGNKNSFNDEDFILQDEKNDFMLSSVPSSKRRSTFAQIWVWVGFGYVVTGLFVGGVLAGHGNNNGLKPAQAALAIALAMGFLFIFTGFLGIIAQRTGLNLSLLSRYTYGSKGMILPMGAMALMTLGWFSNITGMVGDIWGQFLGNPSGILIIDPTKLGYDIDFITLEAFLATVIWGLVFTYTAAKGIKAIEKVSSYLGWIILIIAGGMGYVMLQQSGGVYHFLLLANQKSGLSVGSGITVLVGSWIAGAVMGVDLFRFNKNLTAVWLGSAACFLITNPILNITGYISAVSYGDYNFVSWMLIQSFMLAILGVFTWTVSLWTTNQSELYCNSLYLGPIFDALGKKRIIRSKIVYIVGIFGTLIAALGVYQMFFSDFINILGAIGPPLASPILADYFVVYRKDKRKYAQGTLNAHPEYRWSGIISFIVGGLLGYIFQYHMTLPYDFPSGVAASAIAFIIYIGIYKMTPDYKDDKTIMEKVA
ncbi:MAG: cytosine permease [Tissierellia bacterium]|nr:cytosine permease [Tissierellia bacterium]